VYTDKAQHCQLTVLLAGKSFRSTGRFPCKMRQYGAGAAVPLALRRGCCNSPTL
jgi:hypothetical protein